MTAAFAIFRKDIRPLWPQIALFVGLLIFQSIGNRSLFGGRLSVLPDALAPLLLAAASAYLILAAIHQEAFPGDRQYWLTRPFTWRDILCAKALFVASFINGAVFLTHIAVLAALGIPVWEHVAALLWFQVFLTALILLPAVALGAITSGLPQAVLFCFISVVAYTFGYGAFFRLLGIAIRVQRTGHEWVRALILAAAMTLFAIVIVIVQCRYRRTYVARAVFVVFALAVTIQSRVRFWPAQPPLQHVTLDPTSVHLLPTRSAVDVRIHIDNIPAGVVPVADTIRIEAHRDLGRFSGFTTNEAAIHDFSGADGWLTIYESKNFFAGWNASNWNKYLSGELVVRLFTQPHDIPVPLAGRVVVPGIGVCLQQKADFDRIDIACLSPFPRASLAIDSGDGRKQWIVSQLSADSPFPTSIQFDPIRKFTTHISFLPEELPLLHLVAGQLVGMRQLTFTFQNPGLIR